jgi:hypothetical protein
VEPRREPSRRTARALTGSAVAGVLSLAVLAGCSGSGSAQGGADNAGPSDTTAQVSPAPPGKYSTLPEPCGAVSGSTLHSLLPSSQNYAGDASLTFDTDRRVGCKWSGTVPGGERFLQIDLERVVSYDPTVSDDDQAAQEYRQLAAAAHVPTGTPAPGASGSASGSPTPSPSGTPSASPTASASAETSATPSGSPSAGSDADPSPREVGGIGDEAFLTDVLTTQDSSVHRDVTIVFRDANVLVTVVFSQWSNAMTVIPGSADLQLGAHGLAQELARTIDQ